MNNSTNSSLPTLSPAEQKMFDIAKQVQSVLKPYVAQNIQTTGADNTASIWFSDNRFPLDLLNTGQPGVDEWDGLPEVLEALRNIEKTENVQFEMRTREEGDETAYKATPTGDFKLIITKL